MSYEPSQRTTPQLLEDWAAIMRQLRDRGIIRTNNNPVGDIAEAIVAEHYAGQRAPFGQKNWDVLIATGERIEVKGIRQLKGGSRRSNVSPIRGSDYDSMVIVLLDDDFKVTEGLRIPGRSSRNCSRTTTTSTASSSRSRQRCDCIRASRRWTSPRLPQDCTPNEPFYCWSTSAHRRFDQTPPVTVGLRQAPGRNRRGTRAILRAY